MRCTLVCRPFSKSPHGVYTTLEIMRLFFEGSILLKELSHGVYTSLERMR